MDISETSISWLAPRPRRLWHFVADHVWIRSLLCLAGVGMAGLLLTVGCATSSSKSNSSTRGAGLREYRQVVSDIQSATTASRQSAEAVVAASAKAAPAALAQFEESLHQLEVSSVMARARADAMEKRGAAYFEEWEAELSGSADGAAAPGAQERLAELRRHFETILQGSKEVRQDFRQYLEGLRKLRAQCGTDAKKIDEFRPVFTQSVAQGKKAEQTMDQLLTKVNTALSAVMSGSAPPPFKP